MEEAPALPPPSDQSRKLAELEYEADHLGLSDAEKQEYIKPDNKGRGFIKARACRRLRREARSAGIDEVEYLDMEPDARAEAIALAAERADDPSPTSRSIDSIAEQHVLRSQARDSEELNEVPEIEHMPALREEPSMQYDADYVGDKPPRNLTDVYARFPIGRAGGEDYYIDIERVFPKIFGGVPVAGYLGRIQNLIVDQGQLARYLGGREYRLQVYGPDPRGRCDADGNVIIKALTDTFSFTVPHYPPTLAVLPGVRTNQQVEREKQMLSDPNNPLAAAAVGQMPSPPTTAADANVWKASIDLARETLDQKKSAEEATSKSTIEFLQRTSQQALDSQRADAERRENILRDQLAEMRDQLAEMRKEAEAFKTTREREAALSGQSSVEMAQIRDKEFARIHEQHAQEMARSAERHAEEAKALREAHASEMREVEKSRQQELQRERDRAAETERRLRDDIEAERKAKADEVRRIEEKCAAEVKHLREEHERALSAEEKRFRDKLDAEQKAHEREIRQAERASDVKSSGVTNRLELELEMAKRQRDDAIRERDEARAEKSKSLSDQMDEVRKNAEVIGMVSKSDEEQGVWQIITKGVADGLSNAVGKADLTALAGLLRPGAAGTGIASAARGQAAPSPQLPAAQRPAAAPKRPPRAAVSRRTQMWASQGAEVSAGPAHSVPAQQSLPLGGDMVAGPEPVAKQEPTPEQATAPEPAQPTQAQPQPAPPPPATAPAQPQQQAQPRQPQIPEHVLQNLPDHPLLSEFGAEQIFNFIGQAEAAVNSALSAEVFANAFAQRYHDQAAALVRHEADSALLLAQQMAERFTGAEQSAILRPDGRKWLKQMWALLRAKVGQSSENTATSAPATEPQRSGT